MFSLNISNEPHQSSLLLGGYDTEYVNKKYGGAIWISLSTRTSNYWNIYLESISFTYTAISPESSINNYITTVNEALFDITSRYIYVPAKDYENVIVD